MQVQRYDIQLVLLMENSIFCYNEKWEQTNVYNLETNAQITQALYAKGHVIMEISSTGSVENYYQYTKKVYAYSIQKNEIKEIETPLAKDYSRVDQDMIKMGKEVYFLFSTYSTPVFFIKNFRENSEHNGIYRFDMETLKMRKISDTCGSYFRCLNNKLYVVELGLFTRSLKEIYV